jgi:hypothetical protein
LLKCGSYKDEIKIKILDTNAQIKQHPPKLVETREPASPA